jgi:hypothetical protein
MKRNDMFEFRFDERTGRLTARTWGFWTIEIAERYLDTMAVEVRRARRKTGRLVILVDVSEHGVQPPEVMDQLRRARELTLTQPDDRLAILVAAGLNAAQSRRVTRKHGEEISHRGSFRIFEDRDAALDWLAGAGAERPDPRQHAA